MTKDPTTAILLTLFFGALGLAYSHGWKVAGLVTLGIYLLSLVLGPATAIVWPALVVTSYLRVKGTARQEMVTR